MDPMVETLMNNPRQKHKMRKGDINDVKDQKKKKYIREALTRMMQQQGGQGGY
jgi:hypothetical protein